MVIQAQVNEYPLGVGLSPHIDTHSAFEGAIISLSLAGTCIMEFRKYDIPPISLPSVDEKFKRESCLNGSSSTEVDHHVDEASARCLFQRRSIFLPERSLLVLLGEARYMWHHYIPHHKVLIPAFITLFTFVSMLLFRLCCIMHAFVEYLRCNLFIYIRGDYCYF